MSYLFNLQKKQQQAAANLRAAKQTVSDDGLSEIIIVAAKAMMKDKSGKKVETPGRALWLGSKHPLTLMEKSVLYYVCGFNRRVADASENGERIDINQIPTPDLVGFTHNKEAKRHWYWLGMIPDGASDEEIVGAIKEIKERLANPFLTMAAYLEFLLNGEQEEEQTAEEQPQPMSNRIIIG